jgi:hypothetical protein
MLKYRKHHTRAITHVVSIPVKFVTIVVTLFLVPDPVAFAWRCHCVRILIYDESNMS